MRANPEVVRYLGTGRPSTPVDVWRMMAGFLGQWALRGYGVGLRSRAARLSAASAFSNSGPPSEAPGLRAGSERIRK
jgi:hypothetical protein